jgi:hypothetical protein
MAHESLTKEQQKTMLEQKTKPIVCIVLDDIKRAVMPFLKPGSGKTVEFTCELNWNDAGVPKTDRIQGTSTDNSMHSLLIDGFETIKRRLESADKMREAIRIAEESGEELPLKNFQIWDTDKMRFQVDALIEKKLGGKRVGLRVRWQVKEGCFEFDPYTNKLYQVTP